MLVPQSYGSPCKEIVLKIYMGVVKEFYNGCTSIFKMSKGFPDDERPLTGCTSVPTLFKTYIVEVLMVRKKQLWWNHHIYQLNHHLMYQLILIFYILN